ncbi:MAG: cryptochrome/photolyase family protein [Neomegalonema sp.]|nr:cryptochrome/photolyase family protein [Neomegalonema sp.]
MSFNEKDGPAIPTGVRRLCLICGDQLDARSALLEDFDPARDVLLMCEAAQEASSPPQHRKRLVLFFAAMRHFAQAQRAQGRPLRYHALDGQDPPQSLAESLGRALEDLSPEQISIVQPGDWRVLHGLKTRAGQMGQSLEVLPDRHFLTTPSDFERFLDGRKRVVMEDFYRQQRQRSGWLMEGGVPLGGAWNFDKDNRKSFGRQGPGLIPPRQSFAPDAVTRAVIAMVEEHFPDAPGSLDGFDEPVTRDQALAALEDFLSHRLPCFGDYQDAMAGGQRTLYHSRLSAVMNLHLLDAREVCEAVLAAHAQGRAPLNAVEGFIRQILGWREFVRGIYWSQMPGYARLNALEADLAVPALFWSGQTEMACLKDAAQGLVATGYAHHIERLMVFGLFLLLYGADPYKAHEWHMSMYLDAVDWVSLPNVLGMSQHGDGGLVGTKPYCASGAYIERMSDHCRHCRFDPKQGAGERACPFTALYWDFLARHEARFKDNRRMALQLKNLRNKDEGELREIRSRADQVKQLVP